MELVHQRCAGIDIGKKYALVTIRIAGAGRRKVEVRTRRCSAMTPSILALREDLLAAGVTGVVMESTGQYWKPFYYALEGAGFELVLGNAHDIRNMPGRKSDVSDSRWLAELGAHGLVRPSFVPDPPIRALRDLTRDRTALLRLRAKVLIRVHEVLEDAGIKLTSVASDLNGVSSRAILNAMIAGERDPLALAALARGRLKAKHETLVEALTGRLELASPARPRPVTVRPARVPARLSQKMLSNNSGLLKVGDPVGRVAWSWSLLPAVESPAGAGVPSDVTAVAVVRFFITVLS